MTTTVQVTQLRMYKGIPYGKQVRCPNCGHVYNTRKDNIRSLQCAICRKRFPNPLLRLQT